MSQRLRRAGEDDHDQADAVYSLFPAPGTDSVDASPRLAPDSHRPGAQRTGALDDLDDAGRGLSGAFALGRSEYSYNAADTAQGAAAAASRGGVFGDSAAAGAAGHLGGPSSTPDPRPAASQPAQHAAQLALPARPLFAGPFSSADDHGPSLSDMEGDAGPQVGSDLDSGDLSLPDGSGASFLSSVASGSAAAHAPDVTQNPLASSSAAYREQQDRSFSQRHPGGWTRQNADDEAMVAGGGFAGSSRRRNHPKDDDYEDEDDEDDVFENARSRISDLDRSVPQVYGQHTALPTDNEEEAASQHFDHDQEVERSALAGSRGIFSYLPGAKNKSYRRLTEGDGARGDDDNASEFDGDSRSGASPYQDNAAPTYHHLDPGSGEGRLKRSRVTFPKNQVRMSDDDAAQIPNDDRSGGRGYQMPPSPSPAFVLRDSPVPTALDTTGSASSLALSPQSRPLIMHPPQSPVGAFADPPPFGAISGGMAHMHQNDGFLNDDGGDGGVMYQSPSASFIRGEAAYGAASGLGKTLRPFQSMRMESMMDTRRPPHLVSSGSGNGRMSLHPGQLPPHARYNFAGASRYVTGIAAGTGVYGFEMSMMPGGNASIYARAPEDSVVVGSALGTGQGRAGGKGGAGGVPGSSSLLVSELEESNQHMDGSDVDPMFESLIDNRHDFVKYRPWQDIPWAVAYLLCLATFLISGIVVSVQVASLPSKLPPSVSFSTILSLISFAHYAIRDSLPVLFIGVFACIFVGFGWIILTRWFAEPLVWGAVIAIPATACLVFLWSFIDSIVLASTRGEYWFATGLPYLSILALGISISFSWYLYNHRRRIAITIAVIKLSCQALWENPGIHAVSLGLLVGFVGFSILWVYFFSNLFYLGTLTDDKKGWVLSSSSVYLQLLYAFVFLWTSAIFSYVQTVAISGITSKWYFGVGNNAQQDARRRTDPGQWINSRAAKQQTAIATVSLQVALTTSFGSVCFAALVVSIVRATALAVRYARKRLHTSNQRTNHQNPASSTLGAFATGRPARVVGGFTLWLTEVALVAIERFTDGMNRFALVRVATTGAPLWEAAKDVTGIFRRNMVDPIMADTIAQLLLFLSTFLTSALVALGTYAYVSHGSSNASAGSATLTALVGWACCGYVMRLFTYELQDVIDACYVCYAIDPTPECVGAPAFCAAIRDNQDLDDREGERDAEELS